MVGVDAGWNGAELSGQHALAEPPVARPQHRPAVGGELRGDAQARRPHVPGVQRAEAADDRVGLAPFEIERVQVLTDGAAVVEPQPGIDRQPIPDRDARRSRTRRP